MNSTDGPKMFSDRVNNNGFRFFNTFAKFKTGTDTYYILYAKQYITSIYAAPI